MIMVLVPLLMAIVALMLMDDHNIFRQMAVIDHLHRHPYCVAYRYMLTTAQQ
jgi:hypothetical protein